MKAIPCFLIQAKVLNSILIIDWIIIALPGKHNNTNLSKQLLA